MAMSLDPQRRSTTPQAHDLTNREMTVAVGR
jgi:hypothetical protein